MSASPEPLPGSPAASKEDEGPEEVPEVNAETTAASPDDIGADLSDDDSVLSDVDAAQFDDFDLANVAIDDRPALAIDEENLKLVGRHKRRRTEEDDDGQRKKKKKEGRREKKSHRKKHDSDDAFSGGEEMAGKRSSKYRDGGSRSGKPKPRRVVEEVNEEALDPATSMF